MIEKNIFRVALGTNFVMIVLFMMQVRSDNATPLFPRIPTSQCASMTCAIVTTSSPPMLKRASAPYSARTPGRALWQVARSLAPHRGEKQLSVRNHVTRAGCGMNAEEEPVRSRAK